MKKRRIILLIIIMCIIFPSTISLAKYVSKEQSKHEQKSSEFYFTSNYLKTESLAYEIYSNTVNIDLYNYDLENINNITTSEIIYDVNIKYYSDADVQIGNDVTTTGNSSWTTFNTGKKSTITLEKTETASYAVVTVTSSSPYRKELTSRFNFNSSEYAPMYSLKKLTNGFTLVVMTGNELINSLEVSWPTECGPDNTNPNMSSWTTGTHSNYLTNLSNNTTYSLNFYCTLEVVNITEIENEILNLNSININLS